MIAKTPAMKRPLLALLATAMLVSLQPTGDAAAQNRGRDRDSYQERRGGDGRGNNGRWQQVQQRERAQPRREQAQPRGRGPEGYGPPGQYQRRDMPQPRQFGRGGYLPPDSGARVDDPSRYRLREPPRGYDWVQMGDRYMMVDRRTGQIFDVVR